LDQDISEEEIWLAVKNLNNGIYLYYLSTSSDLTQQWKQYILSGFIVLVLL
jgi:hypothetical protein